MKYALHFVDKTQELPAMQRVELFKIIFEDEISAWVVTDERLRYLIRTQLSEGKQQRMKVWKDIYKPATKPTEVTSRKAIEARIQQAISVIRHRPAAPASSASTTRPHVISPAICATPTAAVNAESSPTRIMRSTKRKVLGDPSQRADATPTPLSRRSAVGIWNPDMTDDDTENEAPHSKRRKIPLYVRASPPTPQVRRVDHRRVIPTSVQTPQRQKRPTVPKVGYQQAHGTVIQWTPEKIAKAREDLREVLEAEAHPPLNGLLFRYWNEDPNEPRNSTHGFISRKYGKAKVNFNQPPPQCDKLDWEEVFYHIDRSGKEIEWQSIFVSTSNNLLWTLQKALKELNNHPSTLRISVIDAHALDPRSVYHVYPYHRKLKIKGEFTKGSFRYAGTHEFVVHKRIPGRAVIHTFNVQDLLRFSQRDQDAYDPIIEQILRLDTLGLTGDLKEKIYPKLKDDAIPLSAVVAIGVAKLTAFSGIKSDSNPEHIQAFVAELIQGWALKLKHQSPEQWSSLATSYANALFEYSFRPRNLKEEMLIKRAFLGGVFWGCSKHFNPRHSSENIKSTYRSAKEIGLEDPGKMAMDEVAAMQMNLMMFEKTQQRRLPGGGHRTQLLLEDLVSDEGFASGSEDEEQEAFDVNKFLTARQSVAGARRSRVAEAEDDDDDDNEDDGIIYE